MRTQEQIIADCEKRFDELKAEKQRRDNDPAIQRPCETCRWFSNIGDDGFDWSASYKHHWTCTEPLVKGFDKYGPEARRQPMPCGPEKALWTPIPAKQPMQSPLDRLLNAIADMIEGK